MNQEYHKLFDLYIEAEIYGGNYKKCVDWAVEQILIGIDNIQINILAGIDPTNRYEVRYYVQKILEDDFQVNDDELESWAGKYIVHLADEFLSDRITIHELDNKLSTLYYKLDYPDWLSMLSRNCEYATDIDNFEKPFLDELNYITGLWSVSKNIDEFRAKYDRKISKSHDVF